MFKFEGRLAQSMKNFFLKTTGLKIISIQEKIVFTTGCFNNTFLVKTTPIKLYFMFPLEVPINNFIGFHPCYPAIKYVQHDNNNCVFGSLKYSLFDAS